jgi:flagellar motor switch protein FliG
MTEGLESTRSAAMLLLALGESEAATVLKQLDASVVQKLGMEMAQLKSASRDEVTAVVGNFVEVMEQQADISTGSDEFIRSVLINALGEERANGIIDRILLDRKSKGLDILKWMEPRAIADVFRHEHPQVLAIVLAYLATDMSAAVLSGFPEWLQADVLMRIAQLDGVQPDALGKLDEMIERQVVGKSGSATANLGGPKAAAAILNYSKPAVLEHIRKSDDALCDKLQDLMFVFGDLKNIDDRGIQTLLREVEGAKLVTALKGADESLVKKFMSNMSQRAAEMIKDDMESRGPVKLSDVEAAQKEVIVAARRLADAGTISLGGSGADEYV